MTAGSGGGMGAEPGASLSSFSLLGGQQDSCLDQSAGKSTDAGKHAVKPQAGLLPGSAHCYHQPSSRVTARRASHCELVVLKLPLAALKDLREAKAGHF